MVCVALLLLPLSPQLNQHFMTKQTLFLLGWEILSFCSKLCPSWLQINLDDHKVCPILFNRDKDFQVCGVNLCQHKITQPPPSTEKQQERTSGALQTDWEGSAKQALPSAMGLKGCASEMMFFNHLKNHTLQGSFLLFGV